MKIKCDVCDKEAASVFCTADEAALCDACDHSVHHANKLASKHHRFSLLYPSSSKDSPLCDICQEKLGFLFCQQDRAILCRDCDIPIHTANEHTQKHNRFLLTGVKLSATSSLFKPSPHDSSVPKSNSNPLIKKPVSVTSSKPSTEKTMINRDVDLLVNQNSTISEYLIDMLPGWHVEDFLDSSVPLFGFSKNDDGMLPFPGSGFGNSENELGSCASENLGIWVPQAPTSLHQNRITSGQLGFLKGDEATQKMKLGKRDERLSDDCGFTVPEIYPQSNGIKRSRTFW